MGKQITEESLVSAAELDAINDVLGELDIEEVVASSPVVEEITEDDLTEIDAEIERALEADATRDEVYEEQDATAIAEETPAVSKTKRAAGPKKASTPRVARDLASLEAAAFVLTDEAPADLEANKIEVMSKRPAQKKIAEKFENILMSIAAGRAPSTYIMQCFAALREKGEISSTELVAKFRASDRKNGSGTYSEGTARSQVGQIMCLFDVLGIASRTKQSLVLNPDSSLAKKLEVL